MMSSNHLKLNLGCGKRMIPGFVNVDKYGSPELKFDLETFPWPWDDNSVEQIMMIHVMEHLGRDPEIFLSIMKELYPVVSG